MTLVLKWAWQHHVLDVEEYDSYEDARSIAGYGSEAGLEALECVEVWDDDGYRLIPGGVVLDEYDDLRREREAAQRARDADNPPPRVVASLSILSPEGERSRIEDYRDAAVAQAEYDRLSPFLSDRVTLTWAEVDA